MNVHSNAPEMSSGEHGKQSHTLPTPLPAQALVLREFQEMLSEVFKDRKIKSKLKSLLYKLSKGTLGLWGQAFLPSPNPSRLPYLHSSVPTL